MKEFNIPGEIYQSDWKGFGDHRGKEGSRTEAFRNAATGGADYAWVIDADDSIEGEFKFPEQLVSDCYTLYIKRGDFSWWRNQIFKLDLKWRYVGVLHEYAEATLKQECVYEKVEGNYSITARTEGNRNVGVTGVEKYSRDAKILETAIEEEPDNYRYQFYLAQSYFDSQQWDKSKEAYQKRVGQGGWNEEAFYSQFRVALICAIQKQPEEVIQMEFLKAHNIRPIRAEPLVELSRINRMNGRAGAAYIFAKRAVEIPFPKNDILFISEDVYRYVALDELGATAFYAGKPHEGYAACKKLLDENRITKEHRVRVETNLSEYKKVLKQIHGDNYEKGIDNDIREIYKQKSNEDEQKNIDLKSQSKEPIKKKLYKKRKIKK